MSKFSNTIEYNLRTTLDASGITQLQGQLASINTQLDQMGKKKLLSSKEVYAAQKDITQLGEALSTSLNPQTGLLDLGKFQKQLSGLSLSQLEQSMSKVGAIGQQAFGNMIGQIGRMDTSFKSITSFADKIFNTMGNTVRWGITASIFQTIQNSLYRAVDYVQELDTSLNNIRIVTSASNEDMRNFALYANEAAQAIGASTTSFTDAAQLYAQNGFNEEDYTRLAEITTKVANVTQQNTTDVSEQITALMEGYHMSIDQVEESLGGMAVVAAASAANLEELATAEQKVASTANSLGVSHEQLTAQIGTIVSVTRQAPESVGNAMRTLYARLADLKMGETLEDGVDLGTFSGQLKKVGIDVLDAEGNLRNLGDVLEELQGIWGTLSNGQQIALGTTLAGKYQLNPFMALMENADMYQEQLEMMQTSEGALEEQQAIYMDSLAAKLQQLATAGEGVISHLFNPDDMKPGIDALTDLLNLVTSLIDSLGGLGPILTGIGGTMTKVFSNQIGQSLNNMITNNQRNSMRQTNVEAIVKQMGGVGDISGHDSSAQFVEQNLNRQSQMSVEQQEAYNAALQQTITLENQVIAAKEQQKQAQEELTQYMRQNSLVRNPLTETGRPSEDTIKFQKNQEDALNKVDTAIANVIGKIDNFDKAQTGLQDGTRKYVDVAKQMSNALGEYGDAFRLAGIDVETFTNQLSSLGKANTAEELEQQRKVVAVMLDEMRQAQQELAARVEATEKVIEGVNTSERNTVSSEAALKAQGDSNEAQTKMLINQEQLQSVAMMIGSITQLIFVWQSFQSLGSIWANADSDDGEKIAQTFQVILFALPSLLSGLADLKGALKDLGVISELSKSQGIIKSFVQTFSDLKSAGVSAGAAIVSGLGSMATAAKAAGVAFKSMMVSIGPLLAISVVLGGISAAIGAAQQDAENKAQAIEDAANRASENLVSIQDAQANFDTLYQQYQEGAASSAELAEAAETLNNLIDDQAAKAYAAAGNWDAYANSISNVAAEQARANQTNMQAATWQAEREFVEAPGGFASGRYHVDNKDFGNAGLNEAWNEAKSLSYNGNDFEFATNTSAESRLQDLADFDAAYQEAIEEATNTLNSIQDTSSDAYKEAEANLENLQDTYNQFTNFKGKYSEQAAAVEEAYQVQADNLLAGHMGESEFQYQGGTVDEYTAQVKAALEAQGTKASDQVVQAFVNGMMNADVAGASELANQAGAEAANDTFTSMLSNADSSDITVTSDGEQDTRAILRSAYNNLTAEQQIELVASLDENASLADIFAGIDNIQNQVDASGEGELSLDIKDPFENFDTEEGRNKYLEDYTDIDSDTLDRYSEILANTEDAQSSFVDAAQQHDEAALADFDESDYDSAEEAAEALEELQDAAKDTNDDIEEFNDQMDKMAAGNARATKSFEELSDTFEDNRKIIEKGDKTSLEYAEAVDEVSNQVAGLLNVDPSALSDGFITSAETMENLQGIIDGDQDALDNLRASAAQDIIQNVAVNMDPNTQQTFYTNINGLLNELNAMNLGVNVTANLDDSQYVQKLNEMITNGQITQAQVTSILSAAGYEGQWEESSKTVPGSEKHYTITRTTTTEDGQETTVEDTVIVKEEPYTATMPVLKGATQKGGIGSIGGASPVRSGGGGGGGSGKKPKSSGGGGGSGKTYEPKEKDKVEDELDRYERVNTELDTLANRYEAVADEQERLVGFDVADNMSKQIGLIKEQIKWEEEKLKIQKEEAEEYRNQLASQYGITYDAEGHITNYANVYKKLLNELNGLIDQYNATTTESGQEALDKQIEDAQDRFDDFNDLIEDYDELVSNSILETEKEIQDFYDQIEDLQIEAFQKAVDAVDNIQDLQESIIDFNAVFTGLDSDDPVRDMITSLENLKTYWDVNTVAVDDYYDELIRRNKEAMKNASAEQKKNLEYQNKVLEAAREQYGKGTFEAGGTGLFDMSMSNLNTILEQMRQFEETGTSTIFGENAGSMYEVGQDIFDQAVDLLSDYEGHLDDLKDAILDAIDEIGDKMDERLETYENINDELEHYADIIEMIHGENAYDQLNQTSQAIVNNNQAQINELQQNIALWKDMLAAMEEGSEEWKAINEYITDAQQDLLDLTSDTVEEMLEMYERGVQNILDNWIGSTGMGDDLDWIAEEWELINRNADYYLDDVNAAYEIQKLQGKYLDLIDGSNSLDIQNQITQQMQQQLGYLREKDKLSEYDVQYANAQLEILQKQIALQEAQRNKSQLQLRRDNQGNYSYVYTADENDTRAAEGDLLDAQNNAYNLSKNQMQQTQADSLSALQDARDTLEQIWTNANLTLEEKTKRTQTIIDSLKEYLAGTSEQLSESEKNIINDFIGMCDILTDENDERLQDVYEQIINGNKDAFDQIDTRWQTSITKWLQNMEDFNVATDNSFQELIDNFEGYQTNLDELGELAGITFDDMSSSIQNAVDKTNDLANSTASFISQLKNDAGTVKEYEAALAEMTAKIQDAENGMRAYQEQVNELQSNLTAKEQENANLTSQVQDLQSQIDAMKNPGGSGSGSGSGAGGTSELAWGIAQAIWTYGGASGWGNDPLRSTKLTKAYGTAFAKQVQSIINQNYRSDKLVNYGSMKYSSYQLIGYDTGGYTGKDWTASEKANGKIGLLHEKELVLNKTDTENILNAVDMVRSMVALGRNGNYNDIIRQSENVVDMASVVQPLSDDMGTTYYQVECTFPNATNVDEIQRAILTLPDIAPQYAYKS